MEVKEKNISPVILNFTIISSILLIFANIFRWQLVDIFTIFLEMIIELIIIIVFLVSLICSIVYYIKNIKKLRFRGAIPMAISLITILIVITVPFTDIMVKLDFNSKIEDRNKVISMIKSGELKPNVSYNETLIELPDEYKRLSKGGGDIMLQRDKDTIKVFFFTFRGILDNFSGFVYISDDSQLSETDFDGDYHQIIKIMDHWFWAASI